MIPKISFIVPVFNTEKYLPKCLESILKQDINRMEIIVVDDGSSDHSYKIIESYKNKHSNIQIINKKNGGLSSARNDGLKAAKGEFIAFVDSDDWIVEYSYRELYLAAYENNIDILAFDALKIFPDGVTISYRRDSNLENKIFNGFDFLNNSIRFNTLNVSACFHLFKRELLLKNNIFFIEGVLHEDWIFTPVAYAFSEKILYLNKYCYYYRQHSGTITSDITKKHLSDLFIVFDKFISLPELTNKPNKKMINYYGLVLLQTIINKSVAEKKLVNFVKNEFSSKFIMDRINSLYKNSYIPGLSFRLKIKLLKFSYRLYVFLIKINNLIK
jgi:glycosyltransferase involved in cell wall biosynthesis